MRPAVQYERPCVGRPMAPSAMASFMAMNLGVQRRWCPMASAGVARPALLDHRVGLDERVGDGLLHVDAAHAAGGHVAYDGRPEPRGGRDDDDVEFRSASSISSCMVYTAMSGNSVRASSRCSGTMSAIATRVAPSTSGQYDASWRPRPLYPTCPTLISATRHPLRCVIKCGRADRGPAASGGEHSLLGRCCQASEAHAAFDDGRNSECALRYAPVKAPALLRVNGLQGP